LKEDLEIMERKVNSLRDILRILILTLLFLGFAAGTVSGNINVTLSPSTGTNGSTVNMNFTANDTTNATSWFNFTFPSSFNITGALINYVINGVSSGWANSTGSDYINVTGGGTVAYAGNISYINFSNIAVIGGATSTFITVRTNNSGAIAVDYIVTPIVHSLPPEKVTSYWGTVKILGNTTQNSVVRIYGANSVEIANATSNSNGLYLIQVPWDDLATGADEGVVSGEILTFKVNGSIATTRVLDPIVDAKGNSIQLNLSVVDNKPPVITVTFPGNNTSISIFDRIISGNITDDSALTAANLYVNSSLKNTWASKGIFRLLYNLTQGFWNITISAKDEYDNYNISSTFVNVLRPVYEENVTVTNGTTYTLTAHANTGVDVELLAGNVAVVGTIIINASINASDFNASNIANGIDRYVDINATNLTGNISRVKLTMFYNHSDLDKNLDGDITDAGDLNEDTLTPYWYWDNATGTQVWFPLATGTDLSGKHDKAGLPGPIVSNVVRNTTDNNITVTMNHFSIYTMAGTVITTPTTGCTSNCGGGGGNGGSGGGGGGGKSGENTSNIEAIEKYDLQISKDALTSYRFTHTKNPIMFVNITGNTSLGIITASIEVLKGTSTLVTVPPEGLVYKNANIWVGTSGFATPKNIKEALIKFRIDNAWMSANGVSASDIVLMKWDGKGWIKLETKVLSKDGTNSYFEGKTNSFSPFAIVAKISAGPTATMQPTPAGTPATGATTGKPTPISEKGGISTWLIGLIILAIIGVAAYFLVVKKKE
jgi:PGF-pre-PGF domain-containing protein